MHTGNSSARGFTLVEMSIVLVIIGLIIGGILKGQEVIASARQKAMINQVNAVRAATNTYFDRYRALPGDDPTSATVIDANVTSGNGDGVVGVATGNSTANILAITRTAQENYMFFNGLVASGLLNGGQVTSGTSSAGFGITALPAAPVTGSGLTMAYGTHDGAGTATYNKTAHWLIMQKGVGTPSPAISPRTLQNIDAGIDDGLPDQGGVRGDDVGATGCNTTGPLARYSVSDNTSCYPLFEISQ